MTNSEFANDFEVNRHGERDESSRVRHVKRGNQVATDRPTDRPTLRLSDARRGRAFEEHEFVAMAWQALSKYPGERGIAGARWKRFGAKLDPELGIYALCEVAHQGYHAYMFTELVARERQARIRDFVAEAEKVAEREFDGEFARILGIATRGRGVRLGGLK